jgi:hypothetical protein
MKLTTHLHPVPRSKNTWNYTSTSPYAFIAWCFVNHRDNFNFLPFTERITIEFGTEFSFTLKFVARQVFTAMKIQFVDPWVVICVRIPTYRMTYFPSFSGGGGEGYFRNKKKPLHLGTNCGFSFL